MTEPTAPTLPPVTTETLFSVIGEQMIQIARLQALVAQQAQQLAPPADSDEDTPSG